MKFSTSERLWFIGFTVKTLSKNTKNLNYGSLPLVPATHFGFCGILGVKGLLYIPPWPVLLKILQMCHDLSTAENKQSNCYHETFGSHNVETCEGIYTIVRHICKRKGSMILTIWPSSSGFDFRRSIVIIINGIFYRYSTCQWKRFKFCGCWLVDKDGSFYSIHQNCNRERTPKLFFDNIYRIHRLPNDIVSNMETQFTSNFWRGFF